MWLCPKDGHALIYRLWRTPSRTQWAAAGECETCHNRVFCNLDEASEKDPIEVGKKWSEINIQCPCCKKYVDALWEHEADTLDFTHVCKPCKQLIEDSMELQEIYNRRIEDGRK